MLMLFRSFLFKSSSDVPDRYHSFYFILLHILLDIFGVTSKTEFKGLVWRQKGCARCKGVVLCGVKGERLGVDP